MTKNSKTKSTKLDDGSYTPSMTSVEDPERVNRSREEGQLPSPEQVLKVLEEERQRLLDPNEKV